jgi:mannitol operon repressor
MPRPKKRKQRKPLTFEQVKATFAEFQDESDRAAAILSVSLLDVQLEEIFVAFGADELAMIQILKPDEPIGSLGARRRLCLALGLISPDEASELSILAKIRNEFAHQLHGLDFSVDPIAGWVESLEVPQRVFPRFRFTKRPRFMTSIALMNLLLLWRLQAAKAAKRTPAAKADIPLQPISKEDFERMSTRRLIR